MLMKLMENIKYYSKINFKVIYFKFLFNSIVLFVFMTSF